ncbi:aminodeoxychorismate synthase, subunit I [Paracoccus aminovorans]|uniref:Aminodeoxychorismate synthase, subunit I n=1 Tax=Paracoccus aminovorans TaxID=34004 RepID=A0A1I2XHL1_9RHOB|nr:aminodeoxychorismate synthase component I [Paracoccus aminovorans]CQR85736.1 aminodeoxychorismate synthase [Paracoccus aminovorans]SFH12537.1 aminodeoxychorismate synthase, subunit I [Paracoccus aminovorans]
MILCEFGPAGRPVLFRQPSERVVVDRAEDVAPALDRLEALRRQGAWIAGYLSYELGYALEPALARDMPAGRRTPLLAFAAYGAPEPAPAPQGLENVELSALKPLISQQDYRQAFDRTLDYIAAGDCYQINLTFPLSARLLRGTPLQLYAALAARQPVGFGAFLDLGPGAGPVVVSRSPELFFSLDAEGRIEARPMKGTAPRDPDPARDAALAAALAASEKNRAENLMIVDLLRNDIARISRVGSVRVPELFAVDSFATVHQMSSRVVGQLQRPAELGAMMRALFPCGSITGAPKIRAMQIIREVEPFARGVYCGAIGWMAPDGAAAFSVAIRTLSVWPDGEVTLNVGGGVVQDSTAEGEWEEALWKARYAQDLTTPNCA